MTSNNEMHSRTSAEGLRRSDIVLSLVLLASFSLSLIDLFGHWIASPWSRYSMVFIPLVAWVAYNEDDRRRHPRLGAVMIAVAILIQLASAKAAILAVSRPALACGLMGYLLNRGFASKRCAVLSLFIVPIPYSLASDLGGAAIAEWMFVHLAQLLGTAASLANHLMHVGTASLPVSSTHAGLPLVVLSAGLAGYAALRRHTGLVGAAKTLGVLLLCVPVVQGSAIAIALAALASGAVPAASFILDNLTWLAITLPVVYFTERAVARGELGFAP